MFGIKYIAYKTWVQDQFSRYSTEESIQYPVAIRFYTGSTSAHQIYFS